MDKILSAFQTALDAISSLTIEQITLLSVLVTLIIFVFGKRSETKFKRLELRRAEYAKFIRFLQKFHSGKFKQDDKTKQDFFDMGVSLLLYGSKRVYKKYIFFREYSSNPLIQHSKHNTNDVVVYLIADILKTIRSEVSLTSFSGLALNETISFFINNVGMNPLSKIQSYQARYHIFMIRAELFAFDRCKFVFIRKVYYTLLKPIFGIIALILKFLIVIPLGLLLKRLFPKLAENRTEK